MLFRVLGPLEVEVRGAPTTPPGRGPRALLTALLLRPNRVVPVHALAQSIWGEDLPGQVDKALHQVVARVRRALGPHGAAVVTRPPGYLLAADESTIDAARFEARYRAACAAEDPATAVVLLEEALALWRGPAYGEFADGFARPAATRLEELRLVALEDRAALLIACGAPAQAVAHASDLAAAHPLRERPMEVLMRALHAVGRTGEALTVFQRHRKHLADELGIDPSTSLRELESQILRDDLDTPVRVADRRTVRPHANVPTLPWRTSALLGRDEELRLLAESLASRRLVSVVGPGGVGKTRLVLEARHQHVQRGGTAWWADLTVVAPEDLVHALTEATGVELQLADDPTAALCAALRTRRGLLCIDNAEHLLDALAPVVEALLASTSELVVLVTSRERLALDGECVRMLAPLPLPLGADRTNPAVRLFVERAPGLAQNELGDDDVGLVAQICRRLDGLPLAIELGAARTAAFGLSELAGRLGQRLDLLAGGRRTAAARHRTLRAVVDWSHGLLTPAEARLFHRLAVFPGAFSLDQVETVCVDDLAPRPAAAGLLARLVEQSLVQSAQGRFWLLETLRAYAGERLDASGDQQALRERHARDTAERLAEADRQLWTRSEPSAIAALAELVIDLRAAWDYAVAHDRPLAVRLAADAYDFAYIRQRLDLLAWGERVASWEIAHPSLPRALAAAAAAAWARGHLDQAVGYGERAVAVAEKNPPAAARAMTQLGNLAMFLERSEAALERFRTAALLHREAGEQARALADDVSAAQAMIYAGRSIEAREILAELLPKAHRAGNPSLLSWAYYITGEAAADVDIDRALAAYETAIAYGNQAECKLFVMLAQGSSVAQAAHRSAPAAALEQIRRILSQQEEVGNELIELWVLRYLVVLLDRIEAYRDAAVLAGTLIAARGRHPSFGPYQDPVPTVVDHLRQRLGTTQANATLSEGERLSYPEAVAHARRAIESATAATAPVLPSTLADHRGTRAAPGWCDAGR